MNTKLSGLIGIHLLAAALALFLLPQPFTVYQTLVDKGPTWLGLDASARMTLNYAWLKGWNWGQDIIYTYGPLSFLATKVGWGISRWVFLAADLFVVVNFYLAFKDYLLRSANKAVAFLILFLLVLTFPLYFGSGLSWLLLFFMFYWMYKSYERPVFPHFLMLALVAHPGAVFLLHHEL